MSEVRYSESTRSRLRAEMVGTFIELDSTTRDLESSNSVLSTLSPISEPSE